MLQAPLISMLSIMEILESQEDALGIFQLGFWMVALVVLGFMLIVGLMYLYGKLDNRYARAIVGWSAVPLLVASFIVGSKLYADNPIQRPTRIIASEIEAVVSTELSEQYRFQDVEIVRPTDADGRSLNIYAWTNRLTGDTLEPAKVRVRLEEGPTVPYELRLVGNDLELYPLHGDTTVPDPQELLR